MLGDRPLQRRASMLPLQFPEGRLQQVVDVWPPSLSFGRWAAPSDSSLSLLYLITNRSKVTTTTAYVFHALAVTANGPSFPLGLSILPANKKPGRK
jgi:hypothetical protein